MNKIFFLFIVVTAASKVLLKLEEAENALVGLNFKSIEASIGDIVRCQQQQHDIMHLTPLARGMLERERQLYESWRMHNPLGAFKESRYNHVLIYVDEVLVDIQSLFDTTEDIDHVLDKLNQSLEISSQTAATAGPLPVHTIEQPPLYVLLIEYVTRKVVRAVVLILAPILLLLSLAVVSSVLKTFTTYSPLLIAGGCGLALAIGIGLLVFEAGNESILIARYSINPPHHAPLVYQNTGAAMATTRLGYLLPKTFELLHAYRSQLLDIRTKFSSVKDLVESSNVLSSDVLPHISRIHDSLSQYQAPSGMVGVFHPVAAIHDAQDKVAAHMQALAQMSNQNDQLGLLLEHMTALDSLLRRAEVDVYVYLKSGVETNQFFQEELRPALDAALDGDFSGCIHVLSEFVHAQRAQMTRLEESVSFLRQTGDAVRKVREETANAQTPLMQEERNAWAKKIYAKAGSLAVGVVAVGTSVAAIPTAGTVMVPVAAVSMALSAIGYAQLGGMYQIEEERARSAIEYLIELGQTLLQLDQGLRNHQHTMMLLVEDVRSLAHGIQKAKGRFERISETPELGEHDRRLLSEGVGRVINASSDLNVRYNTAIQQIFARLIETYPMEQGNSLLKLSSGLKK